MRRPLRRYCDPPQTSSAIIIPFVTTHNNVLATPPDPTFDCHCEPDYPSAGTYLRWCPSIAHDIHYYQSHGVRILLGVGGPTGNSTNVFLTGDIAKALTQDTWDLFLGSSRPDRPFDSAVLDGINLDPWSGPPYAYVKYATDLQIISRIQDPRYVYAYTTSPCCNELDTIKSSILFFVHFDTIYIKLYDLCSASYSYTPNFNWGT
jgi:chitinase